VPDDALADVGPSGQHAHVNQTLDVQGFHAAIQAVFDIHQTGHGHALSATGFPVLMGLDGMKTEIRQRDDAGA